VSDDSLDTNPRAKGRVKEALRVDNHDVASGDIHPLGADYDLGDRIERVVMSEVRLATGLLPPAAALRFVVAFGIVSFFADMTYEGMRRGDAAHARD
jgi:hypothetical protein